MSQSLQIFYDYLVVLLCEEDQPFAAKKDSSGKNVWAWLYTSCGNLQ